MDQTLATQLNKSLVTDNPDAGQNIGEEMSVSHFPPVGLDKGVVYASNSSRSSSGSSSNSDDPSSSDSGSPSENISNADSVHSLCVESKDSSVI